MHVRAEARTLQCLMIVAVSRPYLREKEFIRRLCSGRRLVKSPSGSLFGRQQPLGKTLQCRCRNWLRRGKLTYLSSCQGGTSSGLSQGNHVVSKAGGRRPRPPEPVDPTTGRSGDCPG